MALINQSAFMATGGDDGNCPPEVIIPVVHVYDLTRQIELFNYCSCFTDTFVITRTTTPISSQLLPPGN